MHLFIAIPMSGKMKDALCRIQRQMQTQHITGNYIPSENLHLTPAFIGEYPDPDAVFLPRVKPFTLELDGYGSFGNLWWAGLKPCPPLRHYVLALRHALACDDIPFDRKKFSPHITLLRSGVGVPELTVPRAEMVVDHVSLMRSDRGKRGMIYTELRTSEPWDPAWDEG
ncbi:MAG: RNA 2',3'-cyclic phosphodiesterase [Clostridia bacterium]|nr:RNA 2',3'-cyclic phosphodiesterase [Clostridia bacterium]